MSDTLPETCAFHERPFDDNKAEVQRGLRAIMHEATAYIGEVALQEPSILEDAIDMQAGSYAEQRAEAAASPPVKLQKVTAGILGLCDGLFQEYVAAPANVRHADASGDLRSVRIPVGAYGERDARMLLTGAVRAVRVAEQHYDELGAIATDRKNADLLRYHTYQGLTLKDPTAALVVTVQQGIIATAQEAAILAAETVPHFPDGMSLVAELSSQGSQTALARRIGSRVIYTCTAYGQYPSPPLRATENGGIDLSPATLQLAEFTRLQSRQEAQQFRSELPALAERIRAARLGGNLQDASKFEEEYLMAHYQASLGTSCPAATRGGGIQQSMKTILQLAR